MDETHSTLIRYMVLNIVILVFFGAMFYRAEQESIRLYNLQYSEKHTPVERVRILGKMKKRLQWFYGACMFISVCFLAVELVALFRS